MENEGKAQKVVVVTGGAGFVGSHLCERLVRDGYRVISLDNYFTGSPANHVEGVEYRTGHTKDIAKHVSEIPDLVYHLGEYARTEKSFEDIELVWDMNKLGTFAVLEFCRRKRCKLIYAGSSTKFADDGAGRDQSPYAWTKATNTELVRNYSEWFGLRYAITYFYNVYGPREMSGAYGTLVSIFNTLRAHGQPLTVVAPGTQVRNFTHVLDIVEGLVLVGEKGEGDGYGIGSPDAFSVKGVADMFGGEILMLPERKGNRMTSVVDTERTQALGWAPRHTLPEYVASLKAKMPTTHAEKRILIFSTTFYPSAGKAEEALGDLISHMKGIHFDIITTRFSKDAQTYQCPFENATIHRIGYGGTFDKFLLPVLGALRARQLMKKHSYFFAWSLFASYGALAALFARGRKTLPLLITIANQRLANIPWYARIVFRHILSRADQVYADDTYEGRATISLMRRTMSVRSMGEGDALANQVRFTYSSFLTKRTDS